MRPDLGGVHPRAETSTNPGTKKQSNLHPTVALGVMVRRARDEIGKGGVKPAACSATPTQPSGPSSMEPPPPLPPSSRKKVVGVGDANDDEDAIRAYDTALSLCTKDGSDVPVDAVRALFAAAVQRAAEARWRRDSMEDCCNAAAAKTQAAASELATRRLTASRAQASKLSMEIKCREQAQLNQLTLEHMKAAKAGEEARSAELREKFETAVPNIQEKLKVEAERRKQQHLDNDELRAKLVSFAEQTRRSKEACAAQLTPASLRVEIAKAKCEQQEAERRAADARAASLQVELDRAKASHAKVKADTTQRERSLTKIQNILNERKAMSAALETKTKELLASRATIEAECAILREVAACEEAMKGHKKLAERLRGLCGQLELDVEAKRRELAALQSLTSLQ